MLRNGQWVSEQICDVITEAIDLVDEGLNEVLGELGIPNIDDLVDTITEAITKEIGLPSVQDILSLSLDDIAEQFNLLQNYEPLNAALNALLVQFAGDLVTKGFEAAEPDFSINIGGVEVEIDFRFSKGFEGQVTLECDEGKGPFLLKAGRRTNVCSDDDFTTAATNKPCGEESTCELDPSALGSEDCNSPGDTSIPGLEAGLLDFGYAFYICTNKELLDIIPLLRTKALPYKTYIINSRDTDTISCASQGQNNSC